MDWGCASGVGRGERTRQSDVSGAVRLPVERAAGRCALCVAVIEGAVALANVDGALRARPPRRGDMNNMDMHMVFGVVRQAARERREGQPPSLTGCRSCAALS